MSSTVFVSSVYIPRISSFVRHEDIVYEFQTSFIADVVRIDFTTINKKPGFIEENIEANVKSAFVHFLNPLSYTVAIEMMINAFSQNKAYKFKPSCFEEYWLILPNKNPVQHTFMNNAQIVENCRYLEKKVEEQSKTIQQMENRLKDIDLVLYHLVNGLFNKKTQNSILHNYISYLSTEDSTNDTECEYQTKDWDIWPTTRQGDECEERINMLESTIKLLLEK